MSEREKKDKSVERKKTKVWREFIIESD